MFCFIWKDVIWFHTRSPTYLVTGSCLSNQCPVYVLYHGVGLKSNKILVVYSQKICSTIALSIFCWQNTIVDQGVHGCVTVYVSPSVEYLLVPKMLDYRCEGCM